MWHGQSVLVYKRSKKLTWKGSNNSGFVNWFDMRRISMGDSNFERESDFGVSYPSDGECAQTRPAKLPAVLSDLDNHWHFLLQPGPLTKILLA